MTIAPASAYARVTLAGSYAQLRRNREAADELDKVMAGPRPGVVILELERRNRRALGSDPSPPGRGPV